MYNKSILGLVADPSNIILCYTKPIAVGGKAPPNIAEHFTNIEALLERAQILQEQGRNLYFTPATFTSKSRTKAAAKGAHAVWFDIDIRDDKPLKVDFRDKAVEAAVKTRLDEAVAPKPAAVGKAYYGTGHLAQIADFAEAVRDRRPPFVTAESAAETLRTVFDIYDSARLGQSFR